MAASQPYQLSQLRKTVQARFLLQVAQLVELVHGGDEDIARLVAVLWAYHADFLKPNSETRYEPMAFAQVSL